MADQEAASAATTECTEAVGGVLVVGSLVLRIGRLPPAGPFKPRAPNEVALRRPGRRPAASGTVCGPLPVSRRTYRAMASYPASSSGFTAPVTGSGPCPATCRRTPPG